MAANRHPALRNLSYDHRLILSQVREIRRMLDGDASVGTSRDFITRLLRFWAEYMEPHLQEEDMVTYPLFLKYVPSSRREIAVIQTDHRWFRDKFEELADLPPHENCTPLLQSIGQYTLNHIRSEERGIFDKIQASLDETALENLAQQSAAFRAANRKPHTLELPTDLPDTGLLELDFDE